jgi:DNA-binding protein H-NS
MAKKTKSPAEMTLPEIDSRLAELGQEQSELMQARHQILIANRKDVAAQARELIAAAGYDPEEIVPLINRGRRARRAPAAAPKGAGYPRFIDPDNPDNVYTRGVLPGWMKQKMLALGLDPKARADRDSFKESHLRLEAA